MRDIIKGRTLKITCQATPGNPSSTTFYWTKEDTPGFRQNGSILQLHTIQRTSSGIYRCTAENDYNNGEKGTGSQNMAVNVLCKNFNHINLLTCYIVISYHPLEHRSCPEVGNNCKARCFSHMKIILLVRLLLTDYGNISTWSILLTANICIIVN